MKRKKTEAALGFYNLISPCGMCQVHQPYSMQGCSARSSVHAFLSTVEDDLKHIFKVYLDNALLSKFSGGVANDWSNLRATGAMIKTINTESLGVIPFLKHSYDVTAAINRSGRRRGATWSIWKCGT